MEDPNNTIKTEWGSGDIGKAIEFQMWRTGHCIRPHGIPFVSFLMTANEVKSFTKREIKNVTGNPPWNNFTMNNQWMNFLTPSNDTMHDDMEIGLHGMRVKVLVMRRSASHEEHLADNDEGKTDRIDLRAALANEKFEEFCQGKMARSGHEIEFRLDNT